MQLVFKSDLFENRIYRKKYPRDFFASELVEKRIEVNTADVSGTIIETQLEGIYMVSTNIVAPKGYHTEVSSNFSMFVIHLEISGRSTYSPSKSHLPVFKVKNFHYNLYYLPKAGGVLEHEGRPRRTLEIFFTQGLIKNLVGEKYGKVLGKMDNVIADGKPFAFWRGQQGITPELYGTIEQILACPFTGQLRKTYLQSKITSFLLDILIAANEENQKDSEINLSKSDLDSLRIVEQYIETNLNRSLSISELTALAGFNSSKLKREFKRVYGTTIFKYITKLRMKTARDLIGKKGLTIAEAAHEVGYSNPQHFSKAFKRTLGYLPSGLKA